MITIELIPHSKLEADADFQALVAEYSEECSIAGMPETNRDYEQYERFEQAGFSRMFAAYNDEKLVGFLVLLVSPNPHYGCKIGTIESIFVGAEYRKSGAGLKLLKAAEDTAKGMGAVGIFVSAPAGSQLADVMSKMSPYTETNRVFFKGFQ